MVLTREQLEQLDRPALLDYALKMSNLEEHITRFEEKLSKIESENAIISTCNKRLVETVEKLEHKVACLEKTTIQTSQYARNRQIELHRFSEEIPEEDLKKMGCQSYRHKSKSYRC